MNSNGHGETRKDPLILSNEIDLLCDLFESSWKQGDAPDIEDFLKQTDDIGRSTLLVELVKVDLHYRKLRGETVTLKDYESRFPDYSNVLSHVEADTIPDISLTRTWKQPEVRQRIGDYELIDEIGKGAFGHVWRAMHRNLDRTVAVKLPAKNLVGPSQVSMFMHEARAAARMEHPHIVRVHDFGKHDQGGYIVFGLIQGIDLKEWLQLRKPDFRETAGLIAKLADALDHAHKLGVVHRDLKPANVLMDGDSQPHITDFGLAKRLDIEDTIAGTGELMGTVPYMSPEQIRGENKAVDGQSDLYSLGCILYEMLTGRVPFKGDQRETLFQVLHDPPKPPREINQEVPLDLETICLGCLEKEKSDRYPTAGDLRDELNRFLHDEPIQRRPLTRPARAWRWVRKQPALATAIAVIIFLLTTGMSFGLMNLLSPPDDGKWEVQITTEPPGAHVVIMPLDPTTMEPIIEGSVEVDGVTPVSVRLLPDDYQIHAFLEGTLRRIQVRRRVPELISTIAIGATKDEYWDQIDGNALRWEPIIIPPEDITEDMIFVPGTDRFEFGDPKDPNSFSGTFSVPGLYVSPREFTCGDFLRLRQTPSIQVNEARARDPDDPFRPISRAYAMHWAEEAGGRLPTEIEFEYIAQRVKEAGEQESLKGDVDPSRDLTRIEGLLSGVAEWTSSPPLFFNQYKKRLERHSEGPTNGGAGFGVVRGGTRDTIENGPDPESESVDPQSREVIYQVGQYPGVGFRVVKTARILHGQRVEE